MKSMSKGTATRVIESAFGSDDSFVYFVRGAFFAVARPRFGDALRNEWGYTLEESCVDTGSGYAMALFSLAQNLAYNAVHAKPTATSTDGGDSAIARSARREFADLAEKLTAALVEWSKRNNEIEFTGWLVKEIARRSIELSEVRSGPRGW